MAGWRFKEDYHLGKSYLLVYTPFNEQWLTAARTLGGLWRTPFTAERAWQFALPAHMTMSALKENLELILKVCYPNQDEKDTTVSSISLDRPSSRVDPLPHIPFPEAAPKAKAKEKTELTSVQIAEVVTRIVSKSVSSQIDEMKADVDKRLAFSENHVSLALGRYTTQVEEALKKIDQVLLPTVVNIRDHDTIVQTFEGTTHFQFTKLLNLVQILAPERRNVWLSGPAGSGKTTACRQVAEALNLDFYFNGSIDTEYKLSGFIDAQGRLISTAFRHAWEKGGVYLFDECDGSMPSALLAFNAALANSHASFPDGVITRNPKTVILAAANTYGWGGTANYVGRAKQDGAFMDRFNKLPWKYDERLERAAALAVGAGHASVASWIDAVQGTRKLAFDNKASIIVSPRRSINGAELLAGGMSRADVVESQFCDVMEHTAWNMISRYMNDFLRGG